MSSRKPPPQTIDPATEYAQAVLSGDVPAGKLVRLACERHMRDLERQGTDEFPFVWKPDRGDIFERFCLLLRHFEGEFAGKPFYLAGFQKFVSYSVLGWVDASSGYRRYHTAVMRVPRKNGKTAFAAAMALYFLCMDRESGAKVFFAATKRDQAKIGFDMAVTFLKHTYPKFRARFVQKQNLIQFPSGDATLMPLSKENNTQDGLNPHAAICDEIHQWTSRALWDAIKDGMGARRQPLMMDISTAGTSTSSFAYETHRRAENILSGTFEDDSFFAFIAMADKEDEADFANPEVWAKANPGLGTIKNHASIRKALKEVQATPSALTSFLVKHLNVWTNADTRWLDPNDWKAGNYSDLAEKLKGRKCHGALDLAKVSDLSAFALMFPPEEVEKATGISGKYALLAWHWCPGDDIDQRSREHQVPYETWARQGFIFPTSGNTTDFIALRHGIEEVCRDFDVVDVAFDRWGSMETVQRLQEQGMQIVEFGQGDKSMGAPTSEFERIVKGGLLLHEDNPLLAWQAGNVTTQMNDAGGIKPSKRKSREKIDGIVAGIMALGRCMAQEKAAPVPMVWFV